MESFHSLQSFQRFVPLNNSFRMTTKFKPHHFAKKGKCFVQKYAATDMNSKTQLSISSAHAHLCTGDVHPCLLSSFYSIWTQIPFRSSSKIGLLRNCFWFPLCNLLSSPSYHVNHHYDRENLTHSEFSEVKKKQNKNHVSLFLPKLDTCLQRLQESILAEWFVICLAICSLFSAGSGQTHPRTANSLNEEYPLQGRRKYRHCFWGFFLFCFFYRSLTDHFDAIVLTAHRNNVKSDVTFECMRIPLLIISVGLLSWPWRGKQKDKKKRKRKQLISRGKMAS